jgi:zinc protease
VNRPSGRRVYKLKQQYAISCQSDSVNPDSMGTIALTRYLFPRLPGDDVRFPKEQLAALQQITVDDIKRFHQKYYGPKSFTLVVVGDVEIEPVRDAVEKVFSGWEGGIGSVVMIPRPRWIGVRARS